MQGPKGDKGDIPQFGINIIKDGDVYDINPSLYLNAIMPKNIGGVLLNSVVLDEAKMLEGNIGWNESGQLQGVRGKTQLYMDEYNSLFVDAYHGLAPNGFFRRTCNAVVCFSRVKNVIFINIGRNNGIAGIITGTRVNKPYDTIAMEYTSELIYNPVQTGGSYFSVSVSDDYYNMGAVRNSNVDDGLDEAYPAFFPDTIEGSIAKVIDCHCNIMYAREDVIPRVIPLKQLSGLEGVGLYFKGAESWGDILMDAERIVCNLSFEIVYLVD
jgi:hypothetical protein